MEMVGVRVSRLLLLQSDTAINYKEKREKSDNKRHNTQESSH